ncbi:MAG: thiamine-phosphate pyrophosphorylase [Candidatus Deianiraeaceae bacterium]|jgi:thiamine-phosphate pyrophosphorylase
MQIYLISPEKIHNIIVFIQELEEIFTLPQKPTMFQLRLKNTNIQTIEQIIIPIKLLCDKHSVLLILNDNIPLALKYNVGVHIGCHDATKEDVINFTKQSNKVIGVSCYNSIARALDFGSIVHYVSFGAMFPSNTKQTALQCDKSTIINFRKQSNSKISVIGGITQFTIPQMSELLPFIDYICVLSAVWH